MSVLVVQLSICRNGQILLIAVGEILLHADGDEYDAAHGGGHDRRGGVDDVVVSTGRMTTRLLLSATMFHHHEELMAKVFKLHQDA